MDDPVVPDVLASDGRFGALSALTTRIDGIPREGLLTYLIDAAPSAYLDELVRQFHIAGIEGGNMAATDDDKRRLIRASIPLHRRKGTRWAVQRALGALGLSGRVTEWFEYGGQPYYFRIEIDLLARGMDEATFDAMLAMVNEYKSVRSHLERLILSLSNISNVPSYAAATLCGEVVDIYPRSLTEVNQVSAVPRIGIGCYSVETVAVYPQTH